METTQFPAGTKVKYNEWYTRIYSTDFVATVLGYDDSPHLTSAYYRVRFENGTTGMLVACYTVRIEEATS